MSNNIPRPVLVGLALILAVTVYAYVLESGIEYGNVTVEQAKKLIEGKPGLIVLDVRTVTEFEGGHIERAMNIPVDELEGRLSEIDTEDELLVYCRTGNRSMRAVDILHENGFSKIYHVVGAS